MSHIAHPFGHLLRSLNLHIHISRTCLYGPAQAVLCNLRSLDLPTLGRKRRILQRRLIGHHLRHTAGRNQRHIRRKTLIDMPRSQRTAVQTDLRHLAVLQHLKDLLKTLILYDSTNHDSLFSRQKTTDLLNRQLHNPHITNRKRQHETHLIPGSLLILTHYIQH